MPMALERIMCSQELLHQNSIGCLLYCRECSGFHLGMGTSLLRLELAQLREFYDLIQEDIQSQPLPALAWKRYAYTTDSDSVKLVFTYDELILLAELIGPGLVFYNAIRLLHGTK